MKNKIIVGTRGSALALKQSNMVIEALKKSLSDTEIEIKIITTTGDKVLDRSLDKIGGKGLFVLEIEKELRDKEIDIAIHSMKDVPAFIEEGFQISPVFEREDPRDVLISKDNIKFKDLPAGVVIGTSSLRRVAQLKSLRPDLKYVPIRGNIDSRIKKMESGQFQGIILAAAGLNRMGWNENITEYFDVNSVIPAVGQGGLCLEYRKNDEFITQLIKKQNAGKEFRDILAERYFLEEINGSCSIAMGAFGKVVDNKLFLKGFYSESENSEVIVKEVEGNADEYEFLGKRLAEKIKEQA
jgi:hydroxymethylbilane synthase